MVMYVSQAQHTRWRVEVALEEDEDAADEGSSVRRQRFEAHLASVAHEEVGNPASFPPEAKADSTKPSPLLQS
jgi:hypothetical protein